MSFYALCALAKTRLKEQKRSDFQNRAPLTEKQLHRLEGKNNNLPFIRLVFESQMKHTNIKQHVKQNHEQETFNENQQTKKCSKKIINKTKAQLLIFFYLAARIVNHAQRKLLQTHQQALPPLPLNVPTSSSSVRYFSSQRPDRSSLSQGQ